MAPIVPGKTAFLKSTLQQLLSRSWLTDEHIDQMMHLLECELGDARKFDNIHIIDTILSRKILELYLDEQANPGSFVAIGPAYWQ